MKEPTHTEDVPPVCRPTVDRLQLVLDGELPGNALETDPHPTNCAACKGRIAAARLLLSVLARPSEQVPLSSAFAGSVLSSLDGDRLARARQLRRRVVALAGGLALAAAVLVAVWLGGGFSTKTKGTGDSPGSPELANVQPTPAVPPLPELAPTPRPASRPPRLGDEFSKAEQALLGSSRPITEPAVAAPRVLAQLTDVLTRPGGPGAAEPTRISLVDLPDAAAAGLQPVTATMQKAFVRLMGDVGAVSAKPKS